MLTTIILAHDVCRPSADFPKLKPGIAYELGLAILRLCVLKFVQMSSRQVVRPPVQNEDRLAFVDKRQRYDERLPSSRTLS